MGDINEIVFLKDSAFVPRRLSISCHTSVTFQNEDDTAHAFICNNHKKLTKWEIARACCKTLKFVNAGIYEISISTNRGMKLFIEAKEEPTISHISKPRFRFPTKKTSLPAHHTMDRMNQSGVCSHFPASFEETTSARILDLRFAPDKEIGDDDDDNDEDGNETDKMIVTDKIQQMQTKSAYSDDGDEDYTTDNDEFVNMRLMAKEQKFVATPSHGLREVREPREVTFSAGKVQRHSPASVSSNSSFDDTDDSNLGAMTSSAPRSADARPERPWKGNATLDRVDKPLVGKNFSPKYQQLCHAVFIEDFDFTSEYVTAQQGDVLVLELSPSVPLHAEHILVATESGPSKTVLFESPMLQRGDVTSYRVCLERPGDFIITCKVYNDMRCFVSVRATNAVSQAVSRSPSGRGQGPDTAVVRASRKADRVHHSFLNSSAFSGDGRSWYSHGPHSQMKRNKDRDRDQCGGRGGIGGGESVEGLSPGWGSPLRQKVAASNFRQHMAGITRKHELESVAASPVNALVLLGLGHGFLAPLSDQLSETWSSCVDSDDSFSVTSGGIPSPTHMPPRFVGGQADSPMIMAAIDEAETGEDRQWRGTEVAGTRMRGRKGRVDAMGVTRLHQLGLSTLDGDDSNRERGCVVSDSSTGDEAYSCAWTRSSDSKARMQTTPFSDDENEHSNAKGLSSFNFSASWQESNRTERHSPTNRNRNSPKAKFKVVVEDFVFRPDEVVIPVGFCVEFVARGNASTHKLFCDSESGSEFDNQSLDDFRRSFSHVFIAEGIYEVKNEIFSFMVCRITVSLSATEPFVGGKVIERVKQLHSHLPISISSSVPQQAVPQHMMPFVIDEGLVYIPTEDDMKKMATYERQNHVEANKASPVKSVDVEYQPGLFGSFLNPTGGKLRTVAVCSPVIVNELAVGDESQSRHIIDDDESTMALSEGLDRDAKTKKKKKKKKSNKKKKKTRPTQPLDSDCDSDDEVEGAPSSIFEADDEESALHVPLLADCLMTRPSIAGNVPAAVEGDPTSWPISSSKANIVTVSTTVTSVITSITASSVPVAAAHSIQAPIDVSMFHNDNDSYDLMRSLVNGNEFGGGDSDPFNDDLEWVNDGEFCDDDLNEEQVMTLLQEDIGTEDHSKLSPGAGTPSMWDKYFQQEEASEIALRAMPITPPRDARTHAIACADFEEDAELDFEDEQEQKVSKQDRLEESAKDSHEVVVTSFPIERNEIDDERTDSGHINSVESGTLKSKKNKKKKKKSVSAGIDSGERDVTITLVGWKASLDEKASPGEKESLHEKAAFPDGTLSPLAPFPVATKSATLPFHANECEQCVEEPVTQTNDSFFTTIMPESGRGSIDKKTAVMTAPDSMVGGQEAMDAVSKVDGARQDALSSALREGKRKKIRKKGAEMSLEAFKGMLGTDPPSLVVGAWRNQPDAISISNVERGVDLSLRHASSPHIPPSSTPTLRPSSLSAAASFQTDSIQRIGNNEMVDSAADRAEKTDASSERDRAIARRVTQSEAFFRQRWQSLEAMIAVNALDRLFSKSYPIVVINSEKSLRQHVSSESSIASNHGVSAMPANNFPDGQSKEKRKKPRKEGIRTGK